MIEIATTGFWMHEDLASALAPEATVHKLWSLDALRAPDSPIAGIRAIFTYTGAMPIDRSVLNLLPALEFVVVMGAGIDAVDAVAAGERGIKIVNCPGTNTPDVAELAIGLMLATARGIAIADASMRRGEWVNVTSHRVSGRRLGIFGMGNIGRTIARLATAFGMPIFYTTRTPVADVPYTHIPDLKALASAVDILVLAAPATPATYRCVNREVIDALGADGMLVNIARGALVDEDDLVSALSEGRLGGAGLDVFEAEPAYSPVLRTMQNVTLSPHNGANTYESFAAVQALAITQMREYFGL